MEEYLNSASLISLLTLSLLEIVLGIDNIVFISIVAGKLPANQQERARRIGLFLALGVRILLLAFIGYIVGLKADLFSVFGIGFSGRDLILLAGGLFLIGKTVSEIHHKLEGEELGEDGGAVAKPLASFGNTVFQIILIDIVFSFDSILTAVGLSRQLPIMIGAVIISMGIMLAFSGTVASFIEKHPTIKILALSFLIMIGFLLVVEAFDVHVDKGYVYFAMFFALLVEMLNLRLRKRSSKGPIKLRDERMLNGGVS